MKKLFILLFTLITVLFICGEFLDFHYKKYWRPVFDKLDVVIKDTSYYDAVFFGDSRVHCGINPYYVDSVTSLKTYNAGMAGAPLAEISFLMESYLQNHRPPHFTVLSINHANFKADTVHFKNPCYYFFYVNDPMVDSALKAMNYHTQLFKLFPVLKYTGFDDFNKLSIVRELKGEKNEGINYKGFFINKLADSLKISRKNEFAEDDTSCQAGISMVEKLIQALNKKGTVPIMIYPPQPHFPNMPLPAGKDVRIDSAISFFSAKYKVKVFHYENDTDFTNELFFDGTHLNTKGTIIYSKKIGAAIKSMLETSY